MRSAQHQARLIEDVLDLSRVASGKLRLDLANVEARAIFVAALDAVRPAAAAKEITLDVQLADDLGEIIVDRTRLQQVIWNLLSNAVKFTSRGGKVQISAQRDDPYLELAVTDSGIGIEPHFLPHVFEPFRQEEGTTTRVHGGLGLGLSIVRHLVEAHGGRVTAQSEGKGKGATFAVSIPIATAAAVSHPTQAAPDDDDTIGVSLERLDALKILAVDDDPEGRELIAATLRRAGADVRAADSVAAAWHELTEFDAGVIVTDLALPNVDGFEFVGQLREHPEFRSRKVVALTAFSGSVQERARQHFDLVLRKPIDPYTLTVAIAAIARD